MVVSPSEGGWRGQGTVLLVDDEPVVRSLAVRILETAGFRTIEAADGREAVRRYQREGSRIRLVLMDVTMPYGGVEAFRELRRLQPALPVLLMSGFDEKSERHYPTFTDIRSAMHEEPIQFFTALFRDNRSLLDVLDADYVWRACQGGRLVPALRR